jgi:hypothetical protein
MSLMDRFAAGLETLGKRANQALDEGKLRMELLRTRRRLDHAARALGYITYRQSRGEPAPQAEVEALTRRMAEAEADAARLEAEIATLKGRTSPPPGPSTPGPQATGEPPPGGDPTGQSG